jgi:signal transduction histidine kinase
LVSLLLDVPEDLTVRAEPESLRRILTNLAENGLRYTPEGGSVTVRAEPAGDSVWVSVEDTGSGIAAEHLPHLFERFYRVDRHRSRESGGTGLGLAIVKRLLESCGSHIHVESQVGRGTRFWFVLEVA